MELAVLDDIHGFYIVIRRERVLRERCVLEDAGKLRDIDDLGYADTLGFSRITRQFISGSL